LRDDPPPTSNFATEPVDERWHLAHNPDVAESIRAGVVDSAQDHFNRDGYHDGRLPFGL
jgi:hypothetical protein